MFIYLFFFCFLYDLLGGFLASGRDLERVYELQQRRGQQARPKLPCSSRPKVALSSAWRRTRAASTRAILRFCTDAPRQPAALTNKMSCGTVEVTFPMLLSVILIGDIAMALSNRIESSLMQLKQLFIPPAPHATSKSNTWVCYVA